MLQMKKAVFTLLMGVICASLAMAQGTPGIPTSSGSAGSVVPTVDVLGAHNNYGRGCAGCHAPHSGARGSGGNAAANGAVIDPFTGANALFAQDMGPLYGQSFDFSVVSNGMGLGGATNGTTAASYVFVAPSSLVGSTAQGYRDIRGILMCLACHDGSIAKGAMMQNNAYEQQIGALPSTYGAGIIPTLLGADGSSAGYHNDHPVGENATIQAALGSSYYGTGSATNGLNFAIAGISPSQTISSITPVGEYATFMSSYGAPALMAGWPTSGGWNYRLPVNASGVPYILCTTCHNEHKMNVFAASANNPIAGSTSGTYATYFFINSPYNLNNLSTTSMSVASTTQFCRQCHFADSNEANGATYPTSF
jgi:hypothetical protein